VVQGIKYYPELPETVASHFGFSGQPDGWSTKLSFIKMYFSVIGIIAILFLGICFCLSKMSISFINLPNQEYWMSEEHKQKTIDFMIHYSLWFGSATLLLVCDLFYQSIQVHLGITKALSHIWLSLGIFISFTILWIIGLRHKFNKTGESQQATAHDHAGRGV
jgi:uncharacterized membrane protein